MESKKNSFAFNIWTIEILKNFYINNQKSRQESKNSVEKDLYKLMNNSNFGYDCRNNIDNHKFVPIFDEYNKITFINRYHNIFDQKVSQFVTSDLLKQQIEKKFNDKLMKLDPNDRFCEIKLQAIKSERLSWIEAAEKLEKNKKKIKKRATLYDYVDRKNEALTNQRVKSLIDFDEEYSCSIKSIAIEKNSKIKLTTRFHKNFCLWFDRYFYVPEFRNSKNLYKI